jgi:prolipoprotein diacylglyceryl transferase
VLASIPSPPTNVIEIGPLTVHVYGLAIATGALVAIWILRRRYAGMGGDPDIADRAAVFAAVSAIVGARIGYVLPRLGRYLEDPIQIVAIWRGGLTFFGALVGGLLAAMWYLRRKDQRFADFLHAVAPAVPVAQAIGRLGNYFNQELYGRPTELPWALEIDPPNRVPGYELFETFHPTFLYEMLWNLALAAVLVWLDGRVRLRRGSLFLLYLIGYGVGRFWIELLRIDVPDRILGLSRNNWNALFIVVIGAIGLWWWESRKPAEPEAIEHIEGGERLGELGEDQAPDEPVEPVEAEEPDPPPGV